MAKEKTILIVTSVPMSLCEEINAAAESEVKSRSSYVRDLIVADLKEKRREQYLADRA